jgi:NADPH:quinone reductase-like Zn-dependent oxidoreductase
VGLVEDAPGGEFHAGEAVATAMRAWKLLRANGVDQVFIDGGSIAEKVKGVYPEGVDKVLELVGATTLEDSLQCAKQGGVVCMSGIVGN